MMSGRILNRWSAFIFVKCVWADNMTQYFLCRCKDHTASSGYISDSFLRRTGTIFQCKAFLFGSLKPIDVKISDLKTWVAAGPSLCLLDNISGVYLSVRVLLGDSHHPVTDGCEFSPPPKRQVRHICGYLYVVQLEVPENSPFSLLASSLPCCAFFVPPLCHVHRVARALGDTQSQAWALDAFIVQQWVPSPMSSSLLMCSVLVVMSLIRIGFLLRPSPVVIKHSRATNKPLFPADSSPQPCGPCWRSVND